MLPKIQAALIAEDQARNNPKTSQAVEAIKVVPEAAATTEEK